MGILDIFDSPQLLSQLLGGSMGESSMMPGNMQPPTPPPGNGGVGSDAGQAPGAPQPAGIMPMPPLRPPMGAQSTDEGGFAAKPDFVPPQGPQPDFAAAGNGIPTQPPIPPDQPPQAAAPQPAQPQTVTLPMPPPRPPQAALPPGATPTVGQAPGPPMNILPPGGNPPPAPPVAQPMPMAAAPAPRPPASEFRTQPQGANTGGGLAGALGLNRPVLQQALAGAGKGLSAVGALPAGASKGQSIAAGLGGALTGTSDQQNKHFDQLSTAFKDMTAAKNSDNTEAYRAAQSQYLAARAKSLNDMTAAGGKGSNAWQNTPYGKVIQVENEAQKYEKGQQILLQKRWTLNGSTPEQQQQDLDRLGQNVQSYRDRLYKQSGVDPKQADKIKDMGTSADNPFDTKGMSLEQFHAQVPMGGWFKDQNGTVRQRTVAPPGSQSQAQPPGPSAAANSDDQAAMNAA